MLTKSISSKDKKKKGKDKNTNKVLFWEPDCRYQVILNHLDEIDWKKVDDEKLESKCNMYWIDVAAIHERFRTIQPWQTINHFPGMPNIARKNRMAQNLNKMQKIFPKEYAYYPRTWILPSEMGDFRNQFDTYGNSLNNKIFIIKPDAGCQGRGIFLTKTWDKVPYNENVVAQLYIKKPLLIEGYKFDLRLYCFVSSVKPLRAYLFHDGLVRMCTEEYVKPNKSNLDQSCMHLTNYAINKHNDSFQQPDADNDFSGTKRSLQWFMDWIRTEHGDLKADWLWKRMGILCMRTILSILPILSREYDQHFKSFNNVFVDIKKIISSTGDSYGAKSSSSTTQSSSLNSDTDEDNNNSETNPSSTNVDNSSSNNNDNSNSNTNSDKTNSNRTNEESSEDTPQFRGSRCFEILGYDIMIDSNLNPWLVEVNHLPSFGTDSALDKDVKERLMAQVFSVLPVLYDDQQAYIGHHKLESEKRLTAQRKETAQQQQEQIKKQTRPNNNITKKPFNSFSSSSSISSANNSMTNVSNRNDYSHTYDRNKTNEEDNDIAIATTTVEEENNDQNEDFDEDCTPERLLEIKSILLKIYEQFSPEKLSKIDRLLAKYVGHEEEFLKFVFNKYNVSPSLYKKKKNKTTTVPSLPSVAVSTTVTTNTTTSSSSSSSDSNSNTFKHNVAEESQQEYNHHHSNDEDNNHNGTTEEEEEEGDGSEDIEHDMINEDNNTTNNTNYSSNNNNNSMTTTMVIPSQSAPSTPNSNKYGRLSREMIPVKPRGSRSMSPPKTNKINLMKDNNDGSSSATSNRRASATWKSTELEDAQYRLEVLSIHVPNETDEWLKYETQKLTQFSRLYPITTTYSTNNTTNATNDNSNSSIISSQPNTLLTTQQENNLKNEEMQIEMREENNEENDDEDDDNNSNRNNTTSNTNNTNTNKTSGTKTVKSATYEDIIFQAFLHDKRQTMRMRCPLPNRARPISDDTTTGFLPPLEPAPLSLRPTIGNGKGIPGWKAPPKPTTKEPLKQPTQMQLDAATRLSQGLSVSSNATTSVVNARQRNISSNIMNMPLNTNNNISSNFSVVLDPQEYIMNTSGTGYVPINNNSENAWPSTKANRLLEESRLNRLRLEAAKASSAAVLRQQIFYFDPLYGENTFQQSQEQTLDQQQQHSTSNNIDTHDNDSISNLSIHGNSSLSTKYNSHNNTGNHYSNKNNYNSNHNNRQQRFHVINNTSQLNGTQLQGAHLHSNHNNTINYNNNSNNNYHSNISNNTNNHTSNHHHHNTNTTSQNTQEELLRQLFPSWF